MIKERRNPYSLDRGATNPPIFESAEQPAQQALDKKAENARELGLDYEPAQQEPFSEVWWAGEKLMVKQLPLEDFYKPAQRTWVGLTDEEKRQLFDREDYQGWLDYINAIEAKLRSKNT